MKQIENETPVDTKPTGTIDKTTGGSVNFTPNPNDPKSFKYFPDDPNSAENRFNFKNKEPSKFYDPCSESSRMSINCLEQNQDNKAACKEFFLAYRECKKKWMEERRRNKDW